MSFLREAISRRKRKLRSWTNLCCPENSRAALTRKINHSTTKNSSSCEPWLWRRNKLKMEFWKNMCSDQYSFTLCRSDHISNQILTVVAFQRARYFRIPVTEYRGNGSIFLRLGWRHVSDASKFDLQRILSSKSLSSRVMIDCIAVKDVVAVAIRFDDKSFLG